jgi:signal transduction histidine kinase
MKEKVKELERYAVIGKIFPSLFHDILNPLSGFILYLNSQVISDSQMKEQMNLVSESSNKLMEFIKITQQFISNETNKITSVDRIVENVMKLMSVKSKHNNVKINFIRTSNILINSSPLFLYQILINLISNSIDAFEGLDKRNKYINVVIENKNKYIQIKVIDNGKGIDENDKVKIFKQFYTTKEHGTGTGLTNIKNIIENELYGNIKVESKIGIGTEFIINIPDLN